MLKEFKPALAFLGKFLAIYFLGNILYGLFIESYHTHPDAITINVTHQANTLLSLLGPTLNVQPDLYAPTVLLMKEHRVILAVYEGCNGINVMIIFVAFVLAFGGPFKKMVWFLPVGLVVIHLCNLFRISFLYFIVQHYERYFYYVHKYFFTAILYLVIFALWAIWVVRFNVTQREAIDP